MILEYSIFTSASVYKCKYKVDVWLGISSRLPSLLEYNHFTGIYTFIITVYTSTKMYIKQKGWIVCGIAVTEDILRYKKIVWLLGYSIIPCVRYSLC